MHESVLPWLPPLDGDADYRLVKKVVSNGELSSTGGCRMLVGGGDVHNGRYLFVRSA